MESSPDAAALADAEALRARLARDLVLPSYLFLSLGAAVAVQIATTAVGIAGADGRALWWIAAGLVPATVVAVVQLHRFRRRNGVWLGGFAGGVVAGTATAASVGYAASLAVATWAAFHGLWWLVVLAGVGGGAAYALSGRSWVRAYRADPARLGRGESAVWLTVLALAAVAGLVALAVGRWA